LVRNKTKIFDVSSTADIAAEASRLLDDVENAHMKCSNIKGDLNHRMKIGLAIVKQAVYRLAERASGLGDPSGAEKERILTIVKERDDLRVEVERLKSKVTETSRPNVADPVDLDVDLIGPNDRVLDRTTRSTVSVRHRILSTTEFESEGPLPPLGVDARSKGVGPKQSGGGPAVRTKRVPSVGV